MSNIKEMVEKNLTIGDIVIADNVFIEFKKNVSLEDLSIKYGKSISEIKDLLKNLGVELNE